MKIRSTFIAASVAAFAVFSAPAQSALFNFELTGSRIATFTIDSDQAPDFLSSSVFGDQISFDNVVGTFGGVAGTGSIGFGTGVFATLNVTGTPLGFTQFAGPSLFALVGSKPAFFVGTFNLTSIVSGSSTIRISEVAAPAVPEPASWAMMVGGLGLVGAAMRRKRLAVAFA